MERIVENGLGSIRVGLEDYEQADKDENDSRLTSSVRNVYAGILILAKAKLYELSPPDSSGVLIRVLRPKLIDRNIKLARVPDKTIGYDDIKKRFAHCGLTLDWTKVERMQSIRNDLEHFYYGGTRSNVQEALADAAFVIRELMTVLNLDPIRDLGERWWNILLQNERLFDEELSKRIETFSRVCWINGTAEAASKLFSCRNCGSILIGQVDKTNVEQDDIRVVCGACGSEMEIRELMEGAVTNQYYAELYETQTQGGEPPVVRCPLCRQFALVMETQECAVCGNHLTTSATWCEKCQNPISEDEKLSNSHKCPDLAVDEEL
jgi:hypothetical protein